MKVEQNMAARRTKRAGSTATASASGWTASQLVRDMIKSFPDGAARYAARGPGRLDVMGGSAEYSGSLVLSATINEYVCAVVQRRTDGMVRITGSRFQPADGAPPIVVKAAQIQDAAKPPAKTADGRKLESCDDSETARCILGTLGGMVSARVIPNLGGGLSIAVGSTLDDFGNVGREAALACAVASATASAMDAQFDETRAIDLFGAVTPEWFAVWPALADVLGVLCGEPGALARIKSDPCAFAGVIRLPDDVILVGVECGVAQASAAQKYERTRTAVGMGRTLIERIIRYDGVSDLQWEGYLSRITITDYVKRFRDRIPTKIMGAEFLERFGETGDPLGRIDPKVVYKVRSRTEHQIYEHSRALQFVEKMSRAARDGDPDTLTSAGELMYASHWSYGQRCGLGSLETDLLVGLIRRHGAEADVYGAKITGRGCGGVVAVLMRDTQRATAALDRAMNDYHTSTKRQPTLLRGSLPGTLMTGAVRA